MAARFAVTTGNWTGAIWAATSGGAAGSAATPTSSDDVTINKNVTVTLDATSCVANSVTISSGTTGSDTGGVLTASTSANSKLVVQLGISATGSSGGTSGSYSSTVNLDMNSAASYTCEIRVNAVNGTATGSVLAMAGRFTLKGATRKRWTTTSGALTANSSLGVTVADATGWAVGDRLVFISTQAFNSTPRVDVVTIDTVNTGTGAVTWTDGTGTGGAVAYDHATACIVGNFSSNLIIGPNTAGQVGAVHFSGGATQNGTSVCEHVLFDSCKAAESFRGAFGAFLVSGEGLTSCQNNAFYDFSDSALSLNQLTAPTGTRSGNIFYSTRSSAVAFGGLNAGSASTGAENDFVIFRAATGVTLAATDHEYIGGYISGCTTTADQASPAFPIYRNCHIFGNKVVKTTRSSASGLFRYINTSIGTFYSGATNETIVSFSGPSPVIFEDCPLDATGATIAASITSASNAAYVQFLNKGDGTQTGVSAAVQEVYRNTSTSSPVLTRDGSVYKNSTSSLKIDFIGTGNLEQEWTLSVPAKSGTALTLLLYVRKNSSYGASTLPSATLSGLGITPVSATMDSGTAADAWELLTLSYTSGSAPSSDGNLTLTLTGQSATNGAACYFSGVPIAPFVTRCRHYGYLFDETTITRTVDPTISAAFATADAYTGMTITWGSSSSLAITTSQTFQKVVDYTSAKAIANVSSALPLTWAGAAGTPALFAAGNVTISDGAVLNGGGSISMSSYTLSTEFSSGVDYTYTGGTWSQSTTIPTFGGGTVNIGTTGTYEFDTVGDTILSLTPAGAGTYVMSDVTATGELDLRNTTAHAITVELASGVSYTTASNSGGTITVTTPQIYQSVVVSGFTSGSRIQIYDTTNSVELFNGTSSAGATVVSGTTATWTDPVAAAGDRAIRVRVAYVSGATAKVFQELTGLTTGTTSGTASVTYPVTQVNDTVYNNNAIDGSGVTGVTFTDSSPDVVNIDVAANTISWKSIYAAWVYYAFTSTGIATDIDYIEGVDEANYILSNMKVKNTSSPSEPLEVTGGYGRDSTTGAAIDLVDTTGGTLVFAPDHVVSYAVGSGVTSQDKTDIATAVLSAASAAPIASNIKQVNDLTVNGAGTEASPWGP